jgi:hypothetical protein
MSTQQIKLAFKPFIPPNVSQKSNSNSTLLTLAIPIVIVAHPEVEVPSIVAIQAPWKGTNENVSIL